MRLALLAVLACAQPNDPLEEAQRWAATYQNEVDLRRDLDEDGRRLYSGLLADALAASGLMDAPPQFVLLVDRNPKAQLAILYLHSPGQAVLIGASPASTGNPGSFEYFKTPTGVFAHSLANLDFRAQGTRNAHGIRGYGAKGTRVFDFGWIRAPRGWGDHREGQLRLQVHATDPVLLEPKLGSALSKGCIRLPASLIRFLDHYGLLDADYEEAIAGGRRFWVLAKDRQPCGQPGRYLVVVDSQPRIGPQNAE